MADSEGEQLPRHLKVRETIKSGEAMMIISLRFTRLTGKFEKAPNLAGNHD